MNNLVSRNPVQRFKQGRKIVIAKWGDTAPNPVPFHTEEGNPYVGMWYNNEDNKPVGTALIYNTEQVRQRDSENPFYDSAYFVNTPYYQILSNNKYMGPKDYINSYRQTGGHPTIDKEALPKASKKYIKTNGGNSRKTSKASTPTTVFAGHKIGRTGGLNYNINDADKQQLIGTGQFTESNFTNARATQKALNRYFTNSGFGSVTEDGAWGDQSRAALALALSKSKSLTPFNNETTVVKKTPIVPTYTPPTTPINQEIANLKLNVNVPQQTYDRTGVREFIRNKGINPYSFNGAQRRALRMVLNNTADDNDKLLVKEMNIFKQGGLLLPSRNPVIRFRNRNFK